MNARKQKEREEKESEINRRLAGITSHQVEEEIVRLFNEIEKASGKKRKRASKNDRDEALNNIRKNIRLKVSNEFNRLFFEQYAHPGLAQDILANERPQEDFFDALSSGRMLLDN